MLVIQAVGRKGTRSFRELDFAVYYELWIVNFHRLVVIVELIWISLPLLHLLALFTYTF